MSNSFRDLVVWQKSFTLVNDVYKLCQQLPKNEEFDLKSQVQRSAVSIPSNIAEGQQRRSSKEFTQFLSITRGSAAELSTQLQLMDSLYQIDTKQLITELEDIQKMLYSLQNKLG
jgi:four helix bundle protein